MFTIGIFTTHLPYIALVVFYAFFWIFGVSKASAGEIQFSENRIAFEVAAGENFVEAGQNNYNDVQNPGKQAFLPPGYNLTFSAFQKLKHRVVYPEIHWHDIDDASHFSRPPPFLS